MMAPRSVEKAASKRRERTARTPRDRESHVSRSTASHIMATPKANVERRQCSVKDSTAAVTMARPNSTTPASCRFRGTLDAGKSASCGLASRFIGGWEGNATALPVLRVPPHCGPGTRGSAGPRRLGSEKRNLRRPRRRGVRRRAVCRPYGILPHPGWPLRA